MENNNRYKMLNSAYIPPLGKPERAVLERLIDLKAYNSERLFDISQNKVVRDIIKILRRKYFYLIHTTKDGWLLDYRHVSGDSKQDRIARAESKLIHANHSEMQVKREKKREDTARANKLKKYEELQKELAEKY